MEDAPIYQFASVSIGDASGRLFQGRFVLPKRGNGTHLGSADVEPFWEDGHCKTGTEE